MMVNNMLLTQLFTIVGLISVYRVRGLFVQSTVADSVNQQFYLKLYFNCRTYVERDTNLSAVKIVKVLIFLVAREGLEPPTHGL